MASSFFLLLLLISMAPILASSYQFEVGGERGWAEPAGNDSEEYNDWAAKNRFHVGDSVNFKYQKDSVLVVNKEDYENCVTLNPISKFDDGDTFFEFDHYGFFYFISGQPRHCKSGQKMIIRVMVHPEVEPPQSRTTAPPPKAEGDSGHHHGWDTFETGPPGFISGSELSVAARFVTGVVAMFVIVCVFM
ncbi:Early nodulin-like protein [Actinidia chinensis var. chinensis]|uniref:Early nodulin-like protein n=1 Tax=Actinidia chinensis var. chinensis TaxID=1590841 RepID=A0A2R6QD18_ACTCC|nr:Early nodulin-like protein [Actinidia chinensis var. chinensis]